MLELGKSLHLENAAQVLADDFSEDLDSVLAVAFEDERALVPLRPVREQPLERVLIVEGLHVIEPTSAAVAVGAGGLSVGAALEAMALVAEHGAGFADADVFFLLHG